MLQIGTETITLIKDFFQCVMYLLGHVNLGKIIGIREETKLTRAKLLKR